MPQIKDFDSVISACGGRNIWFTIVIQSYAQLSSVYEQDGAAIIKDNIGTTIFFGSNNRATLEEFSKACAAPSSVDGLHPKNSSYLIPLARVMIAENLRMLPSSFPAHEPISFKSVASLTSNLL